MAEWGDTPLLVTPEDKGNDCVCRGGTWVPSAQGGYCLPNGLPTGKMFSKETKGCVPIPGWKEPDWSVSMSGPNKMLWIAAGVAGIALGWYLYKRHKKGKKR